MKLSYSCGGCCVLDDMWHLLSDDNCEIDMVNIARRHSKVYLYMVHMVFKPQIVDDILEYMIG